MSPVRPGSATVEPGSPVRTVRAAANITVSITVVVASLLLGTTSVLIFLVPGLLCIGLEGLVPHRRQHRGLTALATDLTHAIGNWILIAGGLIVTYRAVEAIVDAVIPAAVPAAVAGLPAPLSFTVIFLLTDLANYAFHRASHEWSPLWRLHRVHHSSSQLDWLATARGHALDQILAFTAIIVPAMALGQPSYSGPIIVALFVWPFVCHANVRFHWRLQHLIVTPHFHHWHHALTPDALNRNYGAVLTVWDRWFGTTINNDGFPDTYGASDLQDRADYLHHLLSPLHDYKTVRPLKLSLRWGRPSSQKVRGEENDTTGGPAGPSYQQVFW